MFSVCTARALTWLLLALRRIDHHGIRCLHGLRLPLEHLRRQPGGGAASARPSAWFGLGALQFWQRKARRDEPVAHHTPHPADPGGGCLSASRLLRSLRGFEHAIANGAASAAAASEAQPQEEGEDVSDEHRRSITSVTTVPDDDHLASSSSSALALPEAVRHGHALWLAVLVSTEMGLRRWAATPAAHRVGPRVFNARSFRAVLVAREPLGSVSVAQLPPQPCAQTFFAMLARVARSALPRVAARPALLALRAPAAAQLHSLRRSAPFMVNAPAPLCVPMLRRSMGSFLDKSDVTDRVLGCLKNFQKVDPTKVTETSHFLNDLGLDSLDTVEVVMAFEDEFVIEIPDADAEKIHSCEDAIAYIVQHPHAK